MFCPFSESSGSHSTKKNTLKASYKHVCAKRLLKYIILKWLTLKIILQNVYCNSYYLSCEQTHITPIHIQFQGYVPVYDTQPQETPAEV
jgi:hypothetical protein